MLPPSPLCRARLGFGHAPSPPTELGWGPWMPPVPLSAAVWGPVATTLCQIGTNKIWFMDDLGIAHPASWPKSLSTIILNNSFNYPSKIHSLAYHINWLSIQSQSHASCTHRKYSIPQAGNKRSIKLLALPQCLRETCT